MVHKDIFEADLRQSIHTIFSGFGVKIPIRNDLEAMLIDYLTVLKKLIRPTPRQVFINPELEEKLPTHMKKNEVEYLKKLLSVGKNVNFFQSDKLFQTKFHDHLLYEWNIFHFHLSMKTEKKSNFIKRTNQLLFTYIDDNSAIFLDIEKHTDGIFADEKWLSILDKYFPHILEPYIAKDIIDIVPIVNSKERQSLWNKGYTIGMTKVNGKIFHSPGLGRTTTGHSVHVSMTRNDILIWINHVATQFDERFVDICHELGYNPSISAFGLRFGNLKLELIEKHSQRVILTFPYLFSFNT